jgi:transcription initiation protein SPT3
MTKDEYLKYTEQRQASFTHRKAARFKEFLNLPLHMQLRANDDTLDILGFLAFEVVRSLCVDALAIKSRLEIINGEALSASNLSTGVDGEPPAKRPKHEFAAPVCSLFLPPAEPRSALKPEHIRAAFSEMQRKGRKPSTMMRNFRGGLVKNEAIII